MIDELVSVITPMYNSEKYIADTMESVIAQTYSNWEMIIVDDCSTDNSASIVTDYCTRDDRIHYYRNNSNCGVAKARNNAIQYANGQYIAFLDSDDVWVENKLEKQLHLMKRTGSPFCYGSCSVMDEEGKDTKKNRVVPAGVDYTELLKGNIIPCLTVIIDRKVIKQVEMPLIPHEDYAAWLSILRDYDIEACGVVDIVAVYRESLVSLSGKKGQAAKWTWDIYREYLGLPFGKSMVCFVNYIWNAIKKRR